MIIKTQYPEQQNDHKGSCLALLTQFPISVIQGASVRQ